MNSVIQVAIIAGCAIAIILWARHFPYPSPLVRWLLPPQRRWPARQLREWIETGEASPGFLRFFMRDPDRQPPPGSNIVSPADGTVLDILHHNGRLYVIVSLNVWDVHVVRSPMAGSIEAIIDHGDLFELSPRDELRDEPLYFLREKRCPVQKIIRLATASGPVELRLVTSYLSRRIEIFHPVGASIAKGERLGRMLFGSTGVLELPGHLTLKITKKQRVRAGETVIAELEQGKNT